ncbi:cytochrome c3 family protein [Rhodopila sp.]|uniref:cytochrome c3 family protein n=1 Tax=Rhodopila sp. TaxID=2480087 RepID=UPI003D0C932E
MRQLFAPGADAILRLALLTGILGIITLLVIAGFVSESNYVTTVGVAPAQPVPFSHKHHSGELGIDCRYCHQQVEVQATAGIPPMYTCMTCHSQIWTGSEMLAPVRASLANNTALHWTRVNRLPDYVYFNHSIHIDKNIGCSTCHGAMDQMQLTTRAQAFTMAFCLNCHRNPENFIRTKEQIWNMEWTPPSNQATQGADLVKQYHIRGPAQLTDCSICHR